MKLPCRLYALAFCMLLGPGGPQGPFPMTAARPLDVDTQVVGVLRGLLASPEADVRASALKWIAADPRARADEFIPIILRALKDADDSVRHAALGNMGWIYEARRDGPEGAAALAGVVEALGQKSDRAECLVAIDLLRGSGASGEYKIQKGGQAERALTNNPTVRSVVASLLADPQSALRPELLQVVESSRAFQQAPSIVDAVGKALQDENLTVRSDAADLLINIDRAGSPWVRSQARPLLLAALAENDANVQLRISRALGVPIPPRKAQPPVLSFSDEKVSASDVPFDFNYFTAFVQPLFAKKYGSAACVDCHTPETNATGSFRILAPERFGRYTLRQSRTNFVSVLSVMDRMNPLQSRLILKPLNPRAPEGGLRGLTHDGGVFWDDRYDPDFEIVEGWLKGGKLDVPPERQLDYAYFVRRVEPILSIPGPDGFACVNCHSTHAIFHLQSPETQEGKFSVAQLENNYEAAHRVIDETAPANSFIVRKPTSPREGEPGGLSHAGGVRWAEKKDSWQYRALITWVGLHNLAGR